MKKMTILSFMIILHRIHYMCPQYLEPHSNLRDRQGRHFFLDLRVEEGSRVSSGLTAQVHRTN